MKQVHEVMGVVVGLFIGFAVLACTSGHVCAQAVNINAVADITDREAAKIEREARALIQARDYQKAWATCLVLLPARRSHWTAQYEVAGLMANIALADPGAGDITQKRLDVGDELLGQFLARLKASEDERRPENIVLHNAYLSELAYPLGVLALACGRTNKAVELFDEACALAMNADFLRSKDACDRRKGLVKGLSRYLAAFGREEKAVGLLERHWTLLEGRTWNSREAIRGRAAFEVATTLEEMGNIPAAARVFAEACKLLESARDMAPGAETQSVSDALATSKARLSPYAYGIWAGIGEASKVYQDPGPLRKEFQALADQLADAWVKQDVEAALKVVKDPEKMRKTITEAFNQQRPRSLKWTVVSVGPVEAKATSVCPVVRLEVTLASGEQRSDRDELVFARCNGGWKIEFPRAGGYR